MAHSERRAYRECWHSRLMTAQLLHPHFLTLSSGLQLTLYILSLFGELWGVSSTAGETSALATASLTTSPAPSAVAPPEVAAGSAIPRVDWCGASDRDAERPAELGTAAIDVGYVLNRAACRCRRKDGAVDAAGHGFAAVRHTTQTSTART